jgi:hypothetical protein
MFKTAVGLFKDPRRVDDAVREIEALGLPRNEVRRLKEPATFEVTGVMSFPRLDFEVDLQRELRKIGAGKPEIEAYVEGLRRGGALVLATGREDDNKVDAAAEVMTRYGAVGLTEITGEEPSLPHVVRGSMTSTGDNPVLAGRVREQADGACFFVW